MFPEYRDLISKLKTSDTHFARLFNQHNDLDQKIQNCETGVEVMDAPGVDLLKKQKLQLKDELYAILKKAAA